MKGGGGNSFFKRRNLRFRRMCLPFYRDILHCYYSEMIIVRYGFETYLFRSFSDSGYALEEGLNESPEKLNDSVFFFKVDYSA